VKTHGGATTAEMPRKPREQMGNRDLEAAAAESLRTILVAAAKKEKTNGRI
jgi:hypothetical protein